MVGLGDVAAPGLEGSAKLRPGGRTGDAARRRGRGGEDLVSAAQGESARAAHALGPGVSLEAFLLGKADLREPVGGAAAGRAAARKSNRVQSTVKIRSFIRGRNRRALCLPGRCPCAEGFKGAGGNALGGRGG